LKGISNHEFQHYHSDYLIREQENSTPKHQNFQLLCISADTVTITRTQKPPRCP